MNELKIKAGDVLFIWGHSPIETAIEAITSGPSHCALFLDEKTLVEIQGGMPAQKSLLSNYLKTNDRLEVWQDESLTDQERSNMVSFAETQLGKRYDYLAILAELVRFELHIPLNHWMEGNKRICSSFVNDIALSIGHNWSKVELPAPVDLLKSGCLTKKGELTNG